MFRLYVQRIGLTHSMQFTTFREFKKPKWTQRKVARQFLSRPKAPNLIKVYRIISESKKRKNEFTYTIFPPFTDSLNCLTNNPYEVTFRENNIKLM